MGFNCQKKSNSKIIEKKKIIEFMGMISEKIGAIEKYNIELASQLQIENTEVIFVYNSLPNNTKYIEKLERFGGKIEVISPKDSFLKKSRQIIKLLVKYKPEVIHCHFNFPLIRLIVFWSWLMRVPNRFVSVRSMPGNNPKVISKIWYFLLSYMITEFLAVSNAIKKCLQENYFLYRNNVELLRRGVDMSLSENSIINVLDYRLKNNISYDKKIIGSIAFHHYVKGVDLLLEVMDEIVNNRKRTDVLLFQIGHMSGEFHDNLIKYTKTKNLENNVIWLGLRDDVPDLLKVIDVYCQPSRSEGLGLSIVEAFSARKASIAFDVGGISEVIQDDKSGYLVKPFDINKMADLLLELLDKLEKAKVFGENGYNFVISEFELKNQVSKMIKKYDL